MVIIEAMAKARPVIAPRLTAIPEMVSEGHTRLPVLVARGMPRIWPTSFPG